MNVSKNKEGEMKRWESIDNIVSSLSIVYTSALVSGLYSLNDCNIYFFYIDLI